MQVRGLCLCTLVTSRPANSLVAFAVGRDPARYRPRNQDVRDVEPAASDGSFRLYGLLARYKPRNVRPVAVDGPSPRPLCLDVGDVELFDYVLNARDAGGD